MLFSLILHNRDRAPFVLTRDMAYVINDGDRPTAKFQQFCDLCCSAYNELRKHTTLFVSLLSLVSEQTATPAPWNAAGHSVQYLQYGSLHGHKITWIVYCSII